MFDRNFRTRQHIGEQLVAGKPVDDIAVEIGVRKRRIEQVRDSLERRRKQVAEVWDEEAAAAMPVGQLLEFNPTLERLRDQTTEIKRRAEAGQSADEILAWLNNEAGVKISRAYFYPQYMLMVGGGRFIQSPAWKRMQRRQKVQQISDWHPRAYTDVQVPKYEVKRTTLIKAKMACLASKMAHGLLCANGKTVSRAEAMRLDKDQRCLESLVVDSPQRISALGELATGAGVLKPRYTAKTRRALYKQILIFLSTVRRDQKKSTGISVDERAQECALAVGSALKRRTEFVFSDQQRFAKSLMTYVGKGQNEDNRSAVCAIAAAHLGWSSGQVSMELSGTAAARKQPLKSARRRHTKANK